MRVVYIEEFSNIIKDLRSVVHKDLADLFYGLLVPFVDQFMLVLAMQVFFSELDKEVEVVEVRFQASTNAYLG